MLVEILRVAFRGLLANKMRSLLTMLGIIIGVSAVITLLSLGHGLQTMITDEIKALGSNQVVVYGEPVPSQKGQRALPAQLTNEDIATIANPERVPSALGVSPEFSSRANVVAGRYTLNTPINGVLPAYVAVRNSPVQIGRFIDDDSVKHRSRVAVLGSEAHKKLFPHTPNPVGQLIRINDSTFSVIGVMQEKGGGLLGLGFDSNIFIPITTAQTRLFMPEQGLDVHQVLIQAKNEQSIDRMMLEIESALRENHRLRPDQASNFEVRSQKEMLETFDLVTTGITAFLAAIAGISLLVGGIGVMNIMLVSVTERTREIGLRKALGAKIRDIRLQFLIEAVVMSLTGGFLGIVCGFVFITVISIAVDIFMPTVKATFAVQPFAVLLSTAFSVIIGIFFGLYPAIRASRLSPIEALRYE